MVHVPAAPWMTESEIQLFARWLPFGCIALEFGVGGSTRFFFENGGFKLASVEGDRAWGQSILEDPFLAFFIKNGRLSLHLPDIGPILPDACSTPQDPPMPQWLHYHSEIWDNIDCANLGFILIDGRFRLSCALQSIIRCAQRPTVLMHDFWNRPMYHPVLEFMDVLDRDGSLVVLRQKESIDWRKLVRCLQRSQFDPS